MARSLRIAFVFLLASNWIGIFAADKPDKAVAEKPSVNLEELIARIIGLGGSFKRDDSQPEKPIIEINLNNSEKLTDRDLESIGSLTSLKILSLNGTETSDEGLKHLSELKNLNYLGLIRTKITDAGLKEIVGLQDLEEIRVGNTAITDAGLRDLAKLKNLKMVGLIGTQVTDAGLMAFSEALPNMRHNVGARRGMAGQGGGQRADPDFNVAVARPAYTDKHPSVMFDEAHQNFHTSSGRYKAFADLITNDGYRVIPNKELFTPDRLAACDVLVIANATANRREEASAFTKEECDSVQNWVKKGGALLLVTDVEPYASGSDELGLRFGVEMSTLVVVDPVNQERRGLMFSREKDQLGDHPIMNGRDKSEQVNRVLTFSGQSLIGPEGGVALLMFADTAVHTANNERIPASGFNQALALKFGKGRVVVLGEAGQLSALVVGNPPEPMGMNVPGCDNRIMALNLMHWLSGLID